MVKSLYWRIAQVSIVSGLLISGVAHAQLNLQKLGSSLLSGGATAGQTASSGGVAQLLQTYTGANQQVLSGLSALATSMGLSEAGGQAQQSAALLTGGDATRNALSQANEAHQKLGQELSQAFSKEGAAQTPVDKQGFSNGLESLANGVRQYSQLKGNLASTTSMNPAALLKSGLEPENAKAASYMVKNIPEQLQSLSKLLKQAVEFATNSGIPIPSSVTSVLGAML